MSTDLSLQKSQLLLNLSRHLASGSDLPLFCRIFVDDVQQLVPFLHLSLYLYREKTSSLELFTESGSELADLVDITTDFQRPEIPLHDETSLVARTAVARRPLVQVASLPERMFVGAFPLLSKERLYAVVLVQRVEELAADEQELLEHVCQIAALALENHYLQQRDATTTQDTTRTKAGFLSMVTHELRSPLNTINGYLDLTLQGAAGEITEQQEEFLQRARAGSEQLYAMLEDVLLMSRIDAGQLRLNREIVDLNDLLVDAIEDLELMAKDNQVSVQTDLASDFPPIYADVVRLQQVVRNLLGNALRFTPAGGVVTISCQLFTFPGELNDEMDGRWLKLQVQDTGSGIPAEFLPRIFERFYQVPEKDGGRSDGLGLGLATVKLIVEQHGGRSTVKSQVGKGTTVTCLLPGVLS